MKKLTFLQKLKKKAYVISQAHLDVMFIAFIFGILGSIAYGIVMPEEFIVADPLRFTINSIAVLLSVPTGAFLSLLFYIRVD